jgi:hypothetical protein
VVGIAGHHLAQLNIARLRARLDSPQLADFIAGLEPINALADRSPGFVWRLQTEDGDATAIRAFEWFERMAEAFLVLWCVPAGHRPSVDEGKDRLARLRRDGQSPEAFTFHSPFAVPDETRGAVVDDGWGRPTT